MGRTVIVAYTPKPGYEAALLAVVRRHQTVLRAEGLVSDASARVMRAANGSVIEVFEWASAEAIVQAHSNAAVIALWEEFATACTIAPLADLAECRNMFAEFEPVVV